MIKVLPLPAGVTKPVTFLVPGTLALAVMGTGMIGQSIGTAVDRNYGVLKRLGATPLGRSGLMAAKITMIVVVEVFQVVLLFVVGALLGWSPKGNLAEFFLLALLATVSFTGLGLLMAGLIRYEIMTGLSSVLWFILTLISGMIFPLEGERRRYRSNHRPNDQRHPDRSTNGPPDPERVVEAGRSRCGGKEF